MHYGIDFGTTRTIAAQVDRGNYPVVTFGDTEGDRREYFPSVAALVGDRLVHGFEAVAAAHDGAPALRSFKRLLGEPATNPQTQVEIGGRRLPLVDLLVGHLTALRQALPDGEVSAVISVPAHAHGAQRFMTMEAFRRAGIEVLGLLNEPSAAGFEYTHRQPRSFSSRRTQVVVYDLGGGTFDASLVEADGTSHEVLGSVGVNRLGGDDFDLVLAELVLQAAGRKAGSLAPGELDTLIDDCRDAKERIAPQTRRVVIDVDGQPVLIPVEDFYEATTPLVEQSVEAMAPLVGRLGDDSLPSVAGIYLVGGGSGLPLVPRLLRQRFGRRVHRSPYPAASTAIGLAIAADPDSGFTLADRLWRGFGVFRERESGQGIGFDQIFSREEALPVAGVTTVTRRYRAAHNLGWFRYVEYSGVDDAGEPRGDLVPFAEVMFGFDPVLQGRDSLAGIPIERRPDGPLIEECYTIDPRGIVEVRLTDLDTGFSRSYGL